VHLFTAFISRKWGCRGEERKIEYLGLLLSVVRGTREGGVEGGVRGNVNGYEKCVTKGPTLFPAAKMKNKGCPLGLAYRG